MPEFRQDSRRPLRYFGREWRARTTRRHDRPVPTTPRHQTKAREATMERRRALALLTMLIAVFALLGAPAVEARTRHDRRAARRGWRCHSDKQCKFGTCNDAGQCCTALAGEVACGAGCCNTLLGNSCCNDACADTQSDPDNCGGCGVVCEIEQTCQGGVCTCPDGRTVCGGVCVATQSDDANCGTCGNVCNGGSTCQ